MTDDIKDFVKDASTLTKPGSVPEVCITAITRLICDIDNSKIVDV